MSIFGFGKKKEEQKQPCCCGGSCTPEAMQAAEAEKKESGVKILGGGCAKCNALKRQPRRLSGSLGWIRPLTMCGTLKRSPPMV